MQRLNKKYFNWMYGLICDDPRCKYESYDSLLTHLHDMEFTYIFPMDANREADGLNMRIRFAYETGTPKELVTRRFNNKPCSVFEMMFALCFSCEEDIMGDDEVGNRIGLWFWNMIDSLGLLDMTDDYFDEGHVDEVIGRFLSRKYERNGKGGLFTLHHCNEDLRVVEIWYQMLWYLDENFDFSI